MADTNHSSDPIPDADLYPHAMHPGLVPGISIDEQRNRFGVDKFVFITTAVLILAFIAWGVTNPASVASTASTAFSWGMENAGWLLNVVMLLGIGIMVVLSISKFGTIRLGKDEETPAFSRFSWVAMMFGAGIGVGIFFFGPSEPLWLYLDPPPNTVEGETPQALHQALAQSHFHWGLSAWGLYAFVGAAIGYSMYRRGRPSLISSVFTPLLGLGKTQGVIGRVIDMLAIVATLFGTAATLGLSATQITTGVEIISGAGPPSLRKRQRMATRAVSPTSSSGTRQANLARTAPSRMPRAACRPTDPWWWL